MKEKVDQLIQQASTVLLGKDKEIKLGIVSLISNGHLLIEDIPGVGKTTLVHLLAKLFDLNMSRIQFTNDLLPTDILGTHIFNQSKNRFEFKKGPIFGQLILADELNRATPKTQSALLQVMEERRINIDGEQFVFDAPYLVIATQNPFYQIGTFPLPESQLDRFFMSLNLDLPDREFEKKIIEKRDFKDQLDNFTPILSTEDLIQWQKNVYEIKITNALSDYVLDILQEGRNRFNEGHALSPRSGRDLLLGARAMAMIEGREFVLPEDVQKMAPHVLGHRVGGQKGVKVGIEAITQLLETIPIP